jgi:chromosome segregation ATPase
LKSDIAVTRT